MDLLKALLLCAFISSTAHAESLPGNTFDSVTMLNGSPFQPAKDKMVLYFWATWCPDCKEKLEKEFPSATLPANTALVTVNTDKEAERAAHFVEKEKMGFTVIRDKDKVLTKALKLFSVPSWAVLKKEANGSWNIIESGSGGDLKKILAAAAK